MKSYFKWGAISGVILALLLTAMNHGYFPTDLSKIVAGTSFLVILVGNYFMARRESDGGDLFV